MNIQEEYDMVNAILKHLGVDPLGVDPIKMPEAGSVRDQLQHLTDEYLSLLLDKVPRYKDLPNPRLIPEMILQRLYASMDKLG
jgi:hypothetical protein